MTTTRTYQWTLALKCRDRGHKYFRCETPGELGRIAVADWSGHYPDQTDDGVLWLDPKRPIRVSLKGADIPLLVARDKNREGYTGETALGGLEVAAKLGHAVEFEPQTREFIEAALKVVKIV